jgi:RNA polymerase sigma-70 factor (ECF subfamily)
MTGYLNLNTNSGSFEEIALPYIESIYRASVAICSKPQEAGDLVQDVFLKALENFGSFKPGTNCKAWLLKILRNTWIDQLRHRKVVGQTLPLEEEMIAQVVHDDETVWSNAEDLLENFSDEQVIKALSELPDEQRLTLYLIDVEQLSQMEVADITDVPVGTVKSRASRGRLILKEQLASYAKEMGLMGG